MSDTEDDSKQGDEDEPQYESDDTQDSLASSRSSRSVVTDRSVAVAAGKASSRALKSVRGGRMKKIETESEKVEIKAVETLEAHEIIKPPPSLVHEAPVSKKKAAGPARRGRKKIKRGPLINSRLR